MSALMTNRTPWTDVISLLSYTEVIDSEGYKTRTETATDVSCCFSEGVARGEFYESMKAGLRASCSAEIWEDDYQKEPRVRCEGTDYDVIRHYPTGRGTVMLILQEVTR